jgi:hypothetical protein
MGGLEDLGLMPGGTFSEAVGINDLGMVDVRVNVGIFGLWTAYSQFPAPRFPHCAFP